MKTKFQSYDLLWLSLALLFVLGLFFYAQIGANDYWWYLRVGRDVLATGFVPSIETISYSRAGDAIFNQQWLAGIIFFLVHQAGGVTLTYLIGGLCLAFTYGIIWWMMRQETGPQAATLLIYLLVLGTSNNWVMRPQLLVYPLFALCVWVLYEWEAGQKKYLWLLPLSVLLWVNLHGSFILPFVLAGSAFIFGKGDRKSLLIYIVFSLICMLLNPYGLKVWSFFFDTSSSQSVLLYSTEWRPPNFADWQIKVFFIWLLLFAPLVSYTKQKISNTEWVWFLGLGWLALSSGRFIIWFMFVLAIFSAKALKGLINKHAGESIQNTATKLNLTFSFFVLALSFTYLPVVRNIWQNESISPYELETTPIDAVNWLNDHNDGRGPIWSDYGFSSYISFASPQYPVWIDTRFHIYPKSQWDEYFKINDAQNWQEFFDREKVNLLFLSIDRQPRLIKAVSDSPEWCQQYQDQYALIYLRCEPLE